SGFEYRAQKEKYDNLYKFFKENEKKYQYTGFTKEAINKTQNVGYKNEYFYITYSSRSLKEYRKYYEPLIRKNDKEFKEGMERARKEVNYNKKIELGYTAMAIFKYIEEKGYEGKYTILREYCKNKIQNETKKITFFEDNINICFLDNRVVGKTHLTISLGIEACKQNIKTRFYTFKELIDLLT
ncbi:DUF1672 family protein, partial [Staphylococcus aureus]